MNRIHLHTGVTALALLLAGFAAGASQLDSPVEVIEVGTTATYREVVHAQKAQDNQLILTPDSCFFFPTGPSLTGQTASTIPGAGFNGNNTYNGVTNIRNPGQLVQWPLLPVNNGTWNIEVFIDTTSAGIELIVRLGDIEHRVTTTASNGNTPQPWNLSAAVTNAGTTTAAIRWCELELVNLRGATSLGTVRKVRLSGPSMTSDYLLRARWRPAAIHGGFTSSTLSATGLGSDLFVMEQVADHSSPRSLNFYSPITTAFGYYGSGFDKVPGDPNGRFSASSPNFSMWNYGNGATPPPLERFSHLLALGHPDLIFGGFNHEGTGVKPRPGPQGGWVLQGTPLTSFVSAFSQIPADTREVQPFTRYTGSFWHPGEQRWRLYAAGNKPGFESFRLPSSFIEVPGPPANERTGHIARRMLYRGWIRDTVGTWHQLDSQNVGAGPGAIVNKVWDKTADGWLTREMGGIVHREYLQSGQVVTVSPPDVAPAFMTAAALAELEAAPPAVDLQRIVARPDGTLNIVFHLSGNPAPAKISLYHGNRDGLTLIFEDDNQPDEWNGPLLLGTFAAGSHSVNIPGNALPATGYARLLGESADIGRVWSHRTAQWLTPLEPAPLPVSAPAGIGVAQLSIPNPTAGRSTTYQIVGGNDGALFALDAATGALTLARDATAANLGKHPLTVAATLDGWSGRLPAIHVEAGIMSPSGPYALLSAASLSFGHHSSLLAPFHRRLTVTNVGSSGLFLQNAAFSDASSFSLAAPLPPLIAAGASADLDLVFDPSAPGHFKATLTLVTNEASRPPFTVDLSGGLAPDGYRIAMFDFDPDQSSGAVRDVDASSGLTWTTSSLIDASPSAARGFYNGATGRCAVFGSAREASAQTPIADGTGNVDTWTTFTVTPQAGGGPIHFTGGTATVDTYGFNGLAGTAGANWTLYYSIDGGTTWTALGAAQPGAVASAYKSAGPVALSWDLTPIGSQSGPVDFILDPSTIGYSTNGAFGQRSIGFDNLVLTVASITPPADPALPLPTGQTLALFDFTPDLSAPGKADADGSLASSWTTSDLTDHASGTGALGDGNQNATNRVVVATPFPHLRLSSNRESDAQTPLAAGGGDKSTWFTFSVTPDPGHELDFASGILAIDTFANSTLSGTTSAHWTLYFRRDSAADWTPHGTIQGAAVTGAGTAGPTPLSWNLAAIGNSPEPVHFLLDPQTAGFGTNGTASQRGIGFGNLKLTAAANQVGSNFAAWAARHGLAGIAADSDGDQDQIPAALEYALGLDPTRPEPAPGEFTGTILTFRKNPEAAQAGVVYQIETSTDLGINDPWTAVAPDTDDSHLIQATLPLGHPRRFARLAVTLP